MKKIVFVMAVLMLAAPAWAVTVDIWAVQVGDTNEVEIWYETDGNLPRAFGLNISVTAGNIVDCVPAMTGESSSGDRGYGIFPGTIVIVDGNVTDYNTPVAPSEDPGAEGTGLDTNEIVVEMGSLYTGANTPDTSGLLCTITVSAECDVSISGNAARTGTGSEGIGVVMEDPDETPVVYFAGCTVVLEVVCPCPGDVSSVEASGVPDGKITGADIGYINGLLVLRGGRTRTIASTSEYFNLCADVSSVEVSGVPDDQITGADLGYINGRLVLEGGRTRTIICP